VEQFNLFYDNTQFQEKQEILREILQTEI